MVNRVPAPLLLVTVPGKHLVVRPIKQAWKTRRAGRRAEAAIDRALEKRLPAQPQDVATASIAPPVTTSLPAVTPEAAVEAGRDVVGWLRKHRRDVLAPFAVALALIPMRAVVHLADGYTYWSLGLVGVPVLAVIVVGIWWARQVDPRDVSLRTKWAAWGSVVAAVLWILCPATLPIPMWPHELAVVPDLPYGSRWLVLAGWAGLAAWARWRRFQVRPVEVPALGPAEIWAATMGASGPLAGTRLTQVTRMLAMDGSDVGWKAFVQCEQGRHNTSKVATQAEDIAGAYGRDLKDTKIERTGNALRPLVSVMERDPFEAAPPIFEGPTLTDDGINELGPFYDGEPAYMRLWKPGAGSFDSWFFGKKGSGKSTAVDNALGSWMSAGLVCMELTDLKGGTSLPQWAEVAYRYGTSAADGLMSLRRLDAIGQARLAAMKGMRWYAQGDPIERVGVECLDPSPEWPIWLGVYEESPQLWKIPEAVEIAERFMTLYRACLVSMVAISQMAELRQAWGNSSTLREQIQSGNVWAGYIGRTQAQIGFDDFKPDLSVLEKGTYRSYLTSPVQSREAVLRVRRVVDKWAVARASVPGTPNPVDLAAIEEVEARARRESETFARADEERVARQVAGQVAVDGRLDKAQVYAALKAVVAKNGGEWAKLSAIAGYLGPQEMENGQRFNFTDAVRKHLGNLAEDPSTDVVRGPKNGQYGIAA